MTIYNDIDKLKLLEERWEEPAVVWVLRELNTGTSLRVQKQQG